MAITSPVWDSLAVAAIANEARGLLGARIQRVVQTDALSLGFELYARGERRWLLCTADPRRAGAWFVDDKLGQSPAPPSPMLLLCRKRLRGARLDAVDQPPFERILRLHFQADDETATRSLVLIVEAMGRLGNAILVDDDGLIVESIKRIPSSINRHRQVLPRRPYVGPPEQTKASPLDADASFWAVRLIDPKTTASTTVVGAVRGLSPLAANELVYRVAGRADAPSAAVDAGALARELACLLAPLGGSGAAWQPSCAKTGAFAPYLLTHLDHQPTATLSEAVERSFGQAAAPAPVDQRKAALRGEIEAARGREQRRLQSIERELENAGAADELRTAGELLLAYASQVQVGSDHLDVDGQRIALDPTLSPIENAQRYFERYTRQRDARRRLPALVAAAKGRVRYLDEALVHVALAATPEEVDDLRRELSADRAFGIGASIPESAPAARNQPSLPRARPTRAPQPTSGAAPLRLRLGDHALLVGRTARQNEAALDAARPEDLWLHARGVAGAHVILKVDAGMPDQETIQRAAGIAAGHSEAKAAGSVAVDVAERRHVRKIKGGAPGAVTYAGERTIHVPPTRAESLRNTAAPSTDRSKR